MADAKPKRKACFSDGEIRCLIDLFHQNKDILLKKINNSNTNQKKKKVWIEIATAVNARAIDVKRTVDEVKKKWKDLLSKAKKDASLQKNPPTGGGPRSQISPYSDIILDIYGKDSPSVVGIENAIESVSLTTSTGIEQAAGIEVESKEYVENEGSLRSHTEQVSAHGDDNDEAVCPGDPQIGEVACHPEKESKLIEGVPMLSVCKCSL